MTIPDSRHSGDDLDTTMMDTIRQSRTTGKRGAAEFRTHEPAAGVYKSNELGETNRGKSAEKDSEMSSGLPMSLPSVPYWQSNATYTPSASPPATQYTMLPSVDCGVTPPIEDYPSKAFGNASESDGDCDMDLAVFSEAIDLHDHEDSLSNISNSLRTSENEDGDAESPTEQESESSTFDVNGKRKRRNVRFCTLPPSECDALRKCEYDRTPHPVVIRLTYRDILEMREMKVELGIVTRRQVAGGGSAGALLQNQKRNTSPIRPLSGGSAFSKPDRAPTVSDDLSSPYEPRASEFPSSSRLLSRLREMGEPQPPVRESGMGICVEPTFGLDKVTNQDPLPVGPPRRLSKKTSGDFALEESEFQKELRQARAELEMVAVQEVREKNVHDRDRLKTHGLLPAPGPKNLPSVLQPNSGLELERKPSLSIFSNSYPGVAFPDKNAASLYEPPSPSAGGFATPIGRTFPSGLHSPSTVSPRQSPATWHTSAQPDHARSIRESSDSCQLVGLNIIASDLDLPTASTQPSEFRPPSPILAPFARSTALLALPTPEPSPRSSPDILAPRRPSAPRRESSEPRLIPRFSATAPRKVLKPPSPILAPFARSSVSVPSTVI